MPCIINTGPKKNTSKILVKMERLDDKIAYNPVCSVKKQPFTAQGQRGVTVHYTASGCLNSALNAMQQSGLGYHFLIDRDGSIIQTSPLNHRTDHAGKAEWNEDRPNRSHISVSLVSWGLLNERSENYLGKVVESVKRDGKMWHPATKAQEASVLDLCKKIMVAFKISHQNICGHDECCLPRGRKSDPGSIMSFDMKELRKRLEPQTEIS